VGVQAAEAVAVEAGADAQAVCGSKTHLDLLC